MAGWIPQMASSDAALRVAVATQAARRRVDEDIYSYLSGCRARPRDVAGTPRAPHADARKR